MGGDRDSNQNNFIAVKSVNFMLKYMMIINRYQKP